MENTTFIDLSKSPVKEALSILLKDRTTKHNIVWATDNYLSCGVEFSPNAEITPKLLSKINLQPRAYKSKDVQKSRSKAKAEVMTPSWVCCLMNNNCDDIWFEREDVFNTLIDKEWKGKGGKIHFPDTPEKTWKDYVKLRKIEFACGEAPYVVSRYDTVTAEPIRLSKRMGFLDRKLRVIGENTKTKEEWFEWTWIAYQSSYAYEYQGDNLLIARINLLLTFFEYYISKWGEEPSLKDIRTIANIISWNVWQMDGLTHYPPYNPKLKDTSDTLQIEEALRKIPEEERKIRELTCELDLAEIEYRFCVATEERVAKKRRELEKEKEILGGYRDAIRKREVEERSAFERPPCMIHKRKGKSTVTIVFKDLFGE